MQADGKVVILESESFFGHFDRFPVTPGHLEVIPKRHIASLFDLTRKEEIEIIAALRRGVEVTRSTDLRVLYRGYIENPLNESSVRFCKDALRDLELNRQREGENIGINNGTAAGRTVDHLHIHIIPRYVGDVPDPAGGIRHIIPGKGNYK
ncbi:HIT domain-containing protein [Candidatus Marsarchaeota archaeon]|nr:HIT domain-containing protein [Candidatus Marsarchaeota archaeon]